MFVNMLKKIFMLGALLGAATLASGQVPRVQERVFSVRTLSL